ncbi:MAG: aldehyde dehydrogenase family protein [Phycisphaerales bacterium]|nr:aldehyde dehydrogenase family protein [Phycisphaerales bacterium]
MGLFTRSKSAAKSTARTQAAPLPSTLTRDDGPPTPLCGDPSLESAAQSAARAILDAARSDRTGFMSAAFWSDKLMAWSMKDPEFKVQLFHFVDCFPALKSSDAIYEHLVDFMSKPGLKVPPGLDIGLRAGGLAKGLVAKTMASQIESMASKFIAGTDAQSALPTLQKLWTNGMAFSVDLLGEACLSDEEAHMYRGKYLNLIAQLPGAVALWTPNPTLESNHLGAIPRTNVSIKISSLFARTDPIDFSGSLAELIDALTPILQSAHAHGVFVNFDMEHHAFKDLTLELFMQCCERVPFHAGLAMQAYLRSGEADAQRIIEWTKRTGRVVTVRLVKGAYWDSETIHAEQCGWPVPVWGSKRDTDACFERMAQRFIASTPHRVGIGGVTLALGSHNARSIGAALAMNQRAGLPPAALELQMLHGMGDALKTAAIAQGLRVREYLPVGEMIPGMAYLVRRLLENTSNESWLRSGFSQGVDSSVLVASPHRATGAGSCSDDGLTRLTQGPQRHALSRTHPEIADGSPFFTESLRDFSNRGERDAFAAAVTHARVPPVANDTTVDEALRMVDRLHRAFPAWRDRSVTDRASVLVRAASAMRTRRDELCGIIIREAGKTWREADGDVCEAIDFCEYYARESAHLFDPKRLGAFTGELNEEWFQPRGVAVVISPWNFPLAICCGMTVAALVTGNTVIVKPAEQTPGIAKVLCEILWSAGAPQDALAFCPGIGETVGAALVRHPHVALIAFTGSKGVGLDILEASGRTPSNQEFVKKVVCEMGGKNAIIVDESADLDEAVLAVRQSAFGFAGQKCSACSRVIVVGSAHDGFLHRLIEATRTLTVGDPLLPSTDIGPVIDRDAAEKIRHYVAVGAGEGKLEITLPIPDGLEDRVGKPFVGPTIISGIRPDHRLANEEIFGPVLAVIHVPTFDEALRVANATHYKLTGGLFTRRPSHLARARREYRVGNLYLNRAITGALVGRQPFGGFGMSGVGSKAGGAHYLLQFVEPRTVCENTMRRGFAPGLE